MKWHSALRAEGARHSEERGDEEDAVKSGRKQRQRQSQSQSQSQRTEEEEEYQQEEEAEEEEEEERSLRRLSLRPFYDYRGRGSSFLPACFREFPSRSR